MNTQATTQAKAPVAVPTGASLEDAGAETDPNAKKTAMPDNPDDPNCADGKEATVAAPAPDASTTASTSVPAQAAVQAAPSPATASPAPVSTSAALPDAGLVLDMVIAAGQPITIARDLIARKLPLEAIGKELVAMKVAQAAQTPTQSQTAPGSTFGAAFDRIRQAAAPFVAQGMTRERAMVKAMEQDPSLYQTYLKENPAQAPNRV